MAAYRWMIAKHVYQNIKRNFEDIIFKWHNPYYGLQPAFVTIPIQTPNTKSNTSETSIWEQIFGDGFLWAVPVHRRTVERRHIRRRHPAVLLKPKKNILTCAVCGHYYEAHTICNHCYEKVKLETEAMQETIQKKLGLDPVEKEVAVVYKGEDKSKVDPKKLIVEMERERPHWFSKNLLSKSHFPYGNPSEQQVVQSQTVSPIVTKEE